MSTNHPIALRLSHLSIAVGIVVVVVLAAYHAESGPINENLELIMGLVSIVAGLPMIFGGAFVSALVLYRTEWTIFGIGTLFVFTSACLEIFATSHGQEVYGLFSMAGLAVMIASKPLVLRRVHFDIGGIVAISAVISAVAAFEVATGNEMSVVASWMAIAGIIALTAWPVLALTVWIVRMFKLFFG